MKRGFTDKDVPAMHGKTALVTGANTGLGYEVAKVLAERGAEVIIACRSPQKASSAIDKIVQHCPDARLSSVELDLGDLNSIRSAVDVLQDIEKLDLLINNAGIMTPPLELTVDGFESQFGVNHLGPFALTGLLLDKFIHNPGARVVNTSSLAGRRGRLMFDDINAENGYNTAQRYAMSKLANLVFSNELDRRLRAAGAKALSIACHPGIANTELSRYLPSWFAKAGPAVEFLFNTPAEGAWPTLQAATDISVAGGDYCGPSKLAQTRGPAVTVANRRVSKAKADRLWDVSTAMTGVSYLPGGAG